MRENVITNEWIDAEYAKPWKDRPVLARTDKGLLFVVKWNGMYWTNANTGFRTDKSGNGYSVDSHKITHFYIFEKYTEQ